MSASAVNPQLHLVHLQLPDCVCFSCSSPIASASAVLLTDCVCLSCQAKFWKVPTPVQCTRAFAEFEVQYGIRYVYMEVARHYSQSCPLNIPLPLQVTITSSFARSATSPSFAYVSNLVPDSSLCRASCSPIASASAASPDCINPLQLLLPDCIDPLQLLLPDCTDPLHDCCSPFPSASAVARR